MLLSTAKEEVRARLQELTADFWTDNEVARAINEGVNRFAQEEKWPYLYTVKTGVSLLAENATLALEGGVAYERHFNLVMRLTGSAKSVTAAAATDLFTSTAHGYTTGTRVVFTGLTGGAGITAGQEYFVIASGLTANDFKVSATAGGSSIDVTSDLTAGTVATLETRLRIPQRVGPAEGYRLRQRYTSSQSEPLAYYIASEARPADTSAEFVATVRFVPALNRGAIIEYQYIRDPVLPADDAKALDIPEEYAMAAVAYATGHLFLKELAWSQKADEQFDLYRKSVQDARRQTRKLVLDQGFAWGRTQPEYGFVEDVDFVELVTPPLLG